MSTTAAPNTVEMTAPMSGTVYIPDVFAENVQVILASLDFARVWNTHQNRRMTAQELRQAATYAQALARQCERFATETDALDA